MEHTYETPEIKDLGSLSDLTLLDAPKVVTAADGFGLAGEESSIATGS